MVHNMLACTSSFFFLLITIRGNAGVENVFFQLLFSFLYYSFFTNNCNFLHIVLVISLDTNHLIILYSMYTCVPCIVYHVVTVEVGV